MKVRILAAVAALALGTAISGGAAQAATYYLTENGGCTACTPSGDVGYVTVTQDASISGVLDFFVNLNPSGATPAVVFNSNGNQNHHALAFDLNAAGLQFYNGVVPSGFTLVTSGGNQPPFGSYADVINYTGSASQGSAPSTLSFKLTDTLQNLTLGMLGFNSYNGENVYFSADVAAPNGTDSNGHTVYATGNVGALAGGVPEPATWGLMIMGVACIGAAMRTQRRRAFTAA